MFGYIRPDLPNLYIKDSVLYRSMYCGLCKSIGKGCGTVSRFALSYDLAFLSALLHNIKNVDVEITDQNCILHPIMKRPIAKPNEISQTVAYLNVLMAHYKLTDDINDIKKGKIRRLLFKKGYNSAKKNADKLECIVKQHFERLLQYEKDNIDSIDIAADAFGCMLQELSSEILQDYSSEYTRDLFYNIGKFVYLIDALDDYDKDLSKKNYNVFYNTFKSNNKSELLAQHKKELEFIFSSIFAAITNARKNIKFYFNSDLTDNILLKGIPSVFNKILNKEEKKCKKIRMKY